MENRLESEYEYACIHGSDINEHIPTLYVLAKECSSITEFGVRTGISTRAFLYSRVKFRAYDIKLEDSVKLLFKYAKNEEKLDVDYIQGDTLRITIEPTDFLFIDSKHTYTQLKQELTLHSPYVKKYLVMHDTVSYGSKGEDGMEPGLMAAIDEFLEVNAQWGIKEHYTHNNGLMVLQRCII